MTPSSDWLIWTVIAAGGLLTFAFRASFVFLFERIGAIPRRLERALQFVPAAVLAALVVPALLVQDGQIAVGFGNERLLAGVAATAVAWVSENILATIVTGMVVFWAIRFLP